MKVLKKVSCFLLSAVMLVSLAVQEVKADAGEKIGSIISEDDLNIQPPMSVSVNHNTTLFIIGDSTSRSYHEKEKKRYPREGWGQEIYTSFKGKLQMKRQYILVSNETNATRYTLPRINIESWGKSGATIKSCYESKRFSKMLSRVRAKDYVMIQFGHNDARKSWGESPKVYEGYLLSMVKQIRRRKAIPVLVTSLPQYDAKKTKINAPQYRAKMLEVAKNQKVSCIDLNLNAVRYSNLLGPESTKKWYMFLEAKKYPSYPKGLKDPTHFTKKGASAAARMVAVQIQNTPGLETLSKNINFNSVPLYQTLCKAERYKKRKRYKKKSWHNMQRLRRQGWITLYSANKSGQDFKKINLKLKRSMKSLKKKK